MSILREKSMRKIWYWIWTNKVNFVFEVKSHIFSNPKKALCPAYKSEVKKYIPIIWYPDSARKRILIKPAKLTYNVIKQVKSANRDSRFLDMAIRTYYKNINQISELLKKDLINHLNNMRIIYDIYLLSDKIDKNTSKAADELAKLTMDGASNNIVLAKESEVNELEQIKIMHTINYLTKVRSQYNKGKKIVDCIQLRLNESIKEINMLTAFYRELWQTMGLSSELPKELVFNKSAIEGLLIKSVFDEATIAAMVIFGIFVDEDGTLKKESIKLGDEDE